MKWKISQLLFLFPRTEEVNAECLSLVRLHMYASPNKMSSQQEGIMKNH